GGNDVRQTSAVNSPVFNLSSTERPVIYFNGSSEYLSGTTTSSFKPSNITVMAVYKLRATGNWPRIILQPYASSGWTSPYSSWSMDAAVGATDQPDFAITTSSTPYGTAAGFSDVLNALVLETGTFDGSTIKTSINGLLRGTANASG